jgi:ethanolamine utilization protein EutN
MELAKVIGNVVATVKHEALKGVRLLVIQPQDAGGNNVGEPMIAADASQAGPNDIVAWIGGREAALALPKTYTPVDCAVVAIIDHSWHDRSLL